MKITEKEVRYIAGLSNLSLSDDDIKRYAADMEQILEYVDKLNELDTSEVEPMVQVLHAADSADAFREDTLEASYAEDKALQSAPLSGAGHFKVPRVIER